jgi:hypothetical protein
MPSSLVPPPNGTNPGPPDRPGKSSPTPSSSATPQSLRRIGYTKVEALDRLRYDIDKSDLDTAAQWFADLRARL